MREYFRQKRIRRLLRFYSNLQSYGVLFVHDTPVDLTNRKSVLVSRDAKVHFLLTVFFFSLLGGVLGGLLRLVPAGDAGWAVRLVVLCASGVVAVECADAVLDRITRALDITLDYVLPLAALLMLIVLYVGLQKFGMGPQWAGQLDAWRANTNTRIQSRPVQAVIEPGEGTNWFFVRTATGALQPLDRTDAMLACEARGAGWKLFDGDSTFTPDPVPRIARPLSVWYGGAFPVGQIGPPTGLGRPGVFSSAGADDLRPTLCIVTEAR